MEKSKKRKYEDDGTIIDTNALYNNILKPGAQYINAKIKNRKAEHLAKLQAEVQKLEAKKAEKEQQKQIDEQTSALEKRKAELERELYGEREEEENEY